MYRLVRKDPRLWLTPKVRDAPRMWCGEVWSFVWKLQPEESRGLPSRRKEQMGKGWVVAVTIFVSMLALIYIGTKDIVEVLITFAVIIYVWLLIRWMRQKAGDYFRWDGFEGEPREKDQRRERNCLGD